MGKLLIKVSLVILMSGSLLGLVCSYYVEEMYTPEHLTLSIKDIDLMEIIKQKINDNALKVIIETEEFELIVDGYTKAFIKYLCDGKTTYTLTDETEKLLFERYSDSFLKKYPQLSFLPAHLFIDFLVDRVDLNAYLPKFHDLKNEIPHYLFVYKDYFVSVEFRKMCLLGMLFPWGFYCFISKRISFYVLGYSSLLCSFVFMFVLSRLWYVYLPSDYLWLTSCIEYFISQLNDVFKLCIIGAMGCFFIEWGKIYAKKIFFL